MEPTSPPAAPQTIAHVTGLRDEEYSAFVHAVALAQRSQSTLYSIHANIDPRRQVPMPRAVDLLTRWGALPAGAPPGAEEALGMRHRLMLDSSSDDPVDTLIGLLRQLAPRIVIGATAGRHGPARALFGSVAEALALHVQAPTLLFPADCRGFVDSDTGALHLSRIVVAAGDAEATRVGAAQAAWFAQLAQARAVEIDLLHVEDDRPSPALPHVPDEGLRFHVAVLPADHRLEAALLARAEALHADLIVLATRGHDSLRDMLLGSHAERMLRRADCPVLSIPLP